MIARRQILVSGLLLLATSSVMAQSSDREQRRGPPPEAIKACASAQSGDSCSFDGRRGEQLEGNCGVPEQAQEQSLICMPDNAPEQQERPARQG